MPAHGSQIARTVIANIETLMPPNAKRRPDEERIGYIRERAKSWACDRLIEYEYSSATVHAPTRRLPHLSSGRGPGVDEQECAPSRNTAP